MPPHLQPKAILNWWWIAVVLKTLASTCLAVLWVMAAIWVAIARTWGILFWEIMSLGPVPFYIKVLVANLFANIITYVTVKYALRAMWRRVGPLYHTFFALRFMPDPETTLTPFSADQKEYYLQRGRPTRVVFTPETKEKLTKSGLLLQVRFPGRGGLNIFGTTWSGPNHPQVTSQQVIQFGKTETGWDYFPVIGRHWDTLLKDKGYRSEKGGRHLSHAPTPLPRAPPQSYYDALMAYLIVSNLDTCLDLYRGYKRQRNQGDVVVKPSSMLDRWEGYRNYLTTELGIWSVEGASKYVDCLVQIIAEVYQSGIVNPYMTQTYRVIYDGQTHAITAINPLYDHD